MKKTEEALRFIEGYEQLMHSILDTIKVGEFNDSSRSFSDGVYMNLSILNGLKSVVGSPHDEEDETDRVELPQYIIRHIEVCGGHPDPYVGISELNRRRASGALNDYGIQVLKWIERNTGEYIEAYKTKKFKLGDDSHLYYLQYADNVFGRVDKIGNKLVFIADVVNDSGKADSIKRGGERGYLFTFDEIAAYGGRKHVMYAKKARII